MSQLHRARSISVAVRSIIIINMDNDDDTLYKINITLWSTKLHWCATCWDLHPPPPSVRSSVRNKKKSQVQLHLNPGSPPEASSCRCFVIIIIIIINRSVCFRLFFQRFQMFMNIISSFHVALTLQPNVVFVNVNLSVIQWYCCVIIEDDITREPISLQ